MKKSQKQDSHLHFSVIKQMNINDTNAQKIVLYKTFSVDVKVENETLWAFT